MSWLRTAVNRAVEAGRGNAVTRTVMNYAGTVANHVVGGPSLESQNHRSFSLTLKNVEQNAVSCRGSDRIELLRRWLIALTEAKRVNDISLIGTKVEDNASLLPRTDSMALYVDSDSGHGLMNFWEVFLRSQALEGLTLSMIVEQPNEEEVYLFLKIFGLCLMGGKEDHNAILSSIQDLGRSFSNFQDELLVKREEMLQFAQDAISGLKVSADVARIDIEAFHLQKKLDDVVNLAAVSREDQDTKTNKATPGSLEILKEAVAQLQLCSKLESLLLEEKSISLGDSPDIHFKKIEKLKVLAESLDNSSRKTETRISDHRLQKEEAIDYRLAKAKEVIQTEKVLVDEISVLEKQKDDLEAELEKVKSSLTAALTRLKKTREERDKFDEASNEILIHLKTKEDDLLRSIALCRVEVDVVRTWINFLEDTWLLQRSHAELREKQLNGELEKYGKYFLKVINHHVLACKEELGAMINQIRKSSCNLRDFSEGLDTTLTADTTLPTEPNRKRILEEEYLKVEAKVITIFTVINNMKELLIAKQSTDRGDFDEVNKLIVDIERMREEFRSVERPTLDMETTSIKPAAPAKERLQKSSSRLWRASSSRGKDLKSSKSSVIMAYNELDPEGALAKLETEFQKDSKNSSSEDIVGWEFDGI